LMQVKFFRSSACGGFRERLKALASSKERSAYASTPDRRWPELVALQCPPQKRSFTTAILTAPASSKPNHGARFRCALFPARLSRVKNRVIHEFLKQFCVAPAFDLQPCEEGTDRN